MLHLFYTIRYYTDELNFAIYSNWATFHSNTMDLKSAQSLLRFGRYVVERYGIVGHS